MRRDARYRVEPLGKQHDRSAFACGTEALDRYLKTQASQDTRRHVAATFVLCEADANRVVGYYTLSSLSVDIGSWPDAVARKLPKYPHVPATLLGRLAVDTSVRGHGIGEHLLMDALHRALQASREVASMAIVVDAKDDNAVAFYGRYDFIPFADATHKLFLPMATVERLFTGTRRGRRAMPRRVVGLACVLQPEPA
jgi:predicted N-acetyltransferase YhbS